MRVTRLRLRDFRSYAAADLELGSGVTLLHGRHGAATTNLLQALHFPCTARPRRSVGLVYAGPASSPSTCESCGADAGLPSTPGSNRTTASTITNTAASPPTST